MKTICKHCGAELSVPDDRAGKFVKCSRCGNPFLVKPASGSSSPSGLEPAGSPMPASGTPSEPAAIPSESEPAPVPSVGTEPAAAKPDPAEAPEPERTELPSLRDVDAASAPLPSSRSSGFVKALAFLCFGLSVLSIAIFAAQMDAAKRVEDAEILFGTGSFPFQLFDAEMERSVWPVLQVFTGTGLSGVAWSLLITAVLFCAASALRDLEGVRHPGPVAFHAGKSAAAHFASLVGGACFALCVAECFVYSCPHSWQAPVLAFVAATLAGRARTAVQAAAERAAKEAAAPRFVKPGPIRAPSAESLSSPSEAGTLPAPAPASGRRAAKPAVSAFRGSNPFGTPAVRTGLGRKKVPSTASGPVPDEAFDIGAELQNLAHFKPFSVGDELLDPLNCLGGGCLGALFLIPLGILMFIPTEIAKAVFISKCETKIRAALQAGNVPEARSALRACKIRIGVATFVIFVLSAVLIIAGISAL